MHPIPSVRPFICAIRRDMGTAMPANLILFEEVFP